LAAQCRPLGNVGRSLACERLSLSKGAIHTFQVLGIVLCRSEWNVSPEPDLPESLLLVGEQAIQVVSQGLPRPALKRHPTHRGVLDDFVQYRAQDGTRIRRQTIVCLKR
jgi:hypothetical protein